MICLAYLALDWQAIKFDDGDPIGNTEIAWTKVNPERIRPITIGTRDYYLVPSNNSGFAGGMGRQLQNYDYVTVITKTGTNSIVTAYPSGRTLSRFQLDYKFTFEVHHEPKPHR